MRLKNGENQQAEKHLARENEISKAAIWNENENNGVMKIISVAK
jgi:hypothetical protein